MTPDPGSNKDNPTSNPNPGHLNAVANEDGSITIYDEDGCWVTRYAGNPLWRNNNPGKLKSPAPGQIGEDANGLAIFAEPQAGAVALMRQVTTGQGVTVEQKIRSVGTANGWEDPKPVFDEMWGNGFDPRLNWNTVSDSYPDHNNPGGFVPNPMAVIRQAIEGFTGYRNAQTGGQTPQECPESDSEDVSGETIEESIIEPSFYEGSSYPGTSYP
jgi:hypothetical protein